MAKKARENIKFKSSESHHVRMSTKNKKTSTGRLEKKMYDPTLRRHVVYRESK